MDVAGIRAFIPDRSETRNAEPPRHAVVHVWEVMEREIRKRLEANGHAVVSFERPWPRYLESYETELDGEVFFTSPGWELEVIAHYEMDRP